MKSRRQWGFAAFAVIIVLWQWENVTGIWGGDAIIDGDHMQVDAHPVQVITAPAVFKQNDQTFTAVGTGRALQSVQIYAEAADEVTAIHFEAGQVVKTGDVLLQQDDREEKLAVELAKVELADAKSLLTRYEQAVKDGAVPQSEVDSARAAVAGAKVELAQAELALEKRKIIAPIDGVVGIPKVDVGDRIDSNTLITGLDNRSILHVDFEVPEKLAGVMAKGQKITAITPPFPEQVFSGEVAALESRVDPETRTILTRADIYNKDDHLRPGMSFSTKLEIPGQTYPAVPEIAVQWGRDGAYVWVVRDSKVHMTPVRVVARRFGQVLVEGEITENEPVVVEGLQRLRDGRNVRMGGAGKGDT
ncbi:MAG: efflux RND transporter periplasmic adaptor subunit [Rickettsiales bacterium]